MFSYIAKEPPPIFLGILLWPMYVAIPHTRSWRSWRRQFWPQTWPVSSATRNVFRQFFQVGNSAGRTNSTG